MASHAKFCPDCGTSTAEGGRFCGGCGNPIGLEVAAAPPEATKRSSATDVGVPPWPAALLGGALFTAADAGAGRKALWLARVGWLGVILSLLYLAAWCWTFRFGDRAGLVASHGESGAIVLVLSSPLALLLAVPLARRVSRTGTELDPSRRRKALQKGAALHILALCFGLGYGVMHRDISLLIAIEGQVEQEQAARLEDARRQEALFGELDKQFPPGTSYDERKARALRGAR